MTNAFQAPGLARLAGALPAFLAVAILAGCGPSRPGPAERPGASEGPPRLVILYATCTVNKNYLSPYDPSVPYTPHLGKFAREATVFRRHMTNAGQSGPAFATIFTGNGSHRHGVYFHPTKLPGDQYLIAEAYAENGYETFFWNDHAAASVELDYGQGVEPGNIIGRFLQGDDPRFVEILEKLSADPEYKVFIVTNFTVTHGYYRPDNIVRFVNLYPSEIAGISDADSRRFYAFYREHRLDLEWNFPETVERLELSGDDVATLARVVELFYKSRVQALDGFFGALVGQVHAYGLMDESLIAFTADHGETLYQEHELFKWSHGLQLSPAVLEVPLIIHSPLLGSTPETWDGVTRSLDLFPTMLALSGLESEGARNVEGSDLTPLLTGSSGPDPATLAYSHTTPPREAAEWTLRNSFFPGRDVDDLWTGVRQRDDFYRLRKQADGEWGFEAFDLGSDPAAATNVFDDQNRRHREMATALTEYKKLLVDNYGIDPDRSVETERELSILRGLGYIQ